MTDDMIREHLARARLAESVTLDAGTWTEVLQEVQRSRRLCYDMLGELSAFRAAKSMREASEDLRSRTGDIPIGPYTLTRYDANGYWLANRDGEGMQVKPERLQALMDELWKDF